MDKGGILELLEKKYKAQNEVNQFKDIVDTYAKRNGIPQYNKNDFICDVNNLYGKKNLSDRYK